MGVSSGAVTQDAANGDEDAHLRVKAPERAAAGPASVAYSMRLAVERMGPLRTARTLSHLNQDDGFDCPGCAWPEAHPPQRIEFCENGIKAVAEEATTRRADRAFFARHSVEELAGWSDHQIGQAGRLTEPMYLAPGASHYVPIGWDDAFARIADHLHALATPDAAVFYTSGRTSNEAAFAYALFARCFGTNNLPDCSNMCHESSGAALTQTIGVGKGSVTLGDIHAADLILVVGQNPGTNHPRMLSALERAKSGGARIVAINPLPEAGLVRFRNPQTPRGMIGRGTPIADRYLQVRVNGDLALFRVLNRLLLDAERRAPGTVLDQAFIERHTDGFAELQAELSALDLEQTAAAAGLALAPIEELAAMAARAERTIVCWAMGLTQHRNSVATIREIVNFLLLRGNLGRTGAGVCPVRGHSNVQGDRTMGITEQPSGTYLEALVSEFGIEPPRRRGLDVVESIRAMRDGTARVLFAMGGNFLSATPDTDVTAAALRSLALTVHVSTKPNRSHLVHGAEALILPCLGRTERDVQAGGEQHVSVEDSMGLVHASRGRLAPASEHLLSEVAIVCRLARATLGAGHHVRWESFAADYASLRDRIERVIPGFERFNVRLARPGGFALPHPPRDERRFPTDTGRAHFTVNALHSVAVPAGRLLLQTVRSHDQYNTTIYALNDRYRGIRAGRRVVMVNPSDLHELGLSDGDTVDLVSESSDGVERRAPRFRVVAYPTARGCAATYFPEANVLVSLDSVAEVSNTPASKSIVVELRRAAPPA